MISKATPAFWRYFDDLPEEVRELAEKAYAMWKADPHNASLNFERLSKNSGLCASVYTTGYLEGNRLMQTVVKKSLSGTGSGTMTPTTV